MAAPVTSFEEWLSNFLTGINPDVDLEIFPSYILGILESDSSIEEKEESIEGILSEITEESDHSNLCSDILKKWQSNQSNNTAESSMKDVSIENTMHDLVQQQVSKATRTHVVTDEARQRKAAILAQYAQVSDGETTDDDVDEPESSRSEELLVKNMNAIAVKQREISERDRLKEQHEHKKQRDKEEREKQKQKAADRKEAEKKRTQKGERRR